MLILILLYNAGENKVVYDVIVLMNSISEIMVLICRQSETNSLFNSDMSTSYQDTDCSVKKLKQSYWINSKHGPQEGRISITEYISVDYFYFHL